MGVAEFASGWADLLFLFIWYSVQFVFEIAVIVYVSQTTGWPRRLWATPVEEAPQQQANPLASVGSFAADAAQIARTLKNAFAEPPK